MPHIHISDPLYERLEEGAEREGFDTIDAYAEQLLNQTVEQSEKPFVGDDEEEEVSEATYSQADEQKIKNRLKDLGYID